MEPIVIIGPSRAQSKNWAKAHVTPVLRQPICISETEAEVLRGSRNLVVVIIPGTRLIPEFNYVLHKRLVVINLSGIEQP